MDQIDKDMKTEVNCLLQELQEMTFPSEMARGIGNIAVGINPRTEADKFYAGATVFKRFAGIASQFNTVGTTPERALRGLIREIRTAFPLPPTDWVPSKDELKKMILEIELDNDMKIDSVECRLAFDSPGTLFWKASAEVVKTGPLYSALHKDYCMAWPLPSGTSFQAGGLTEDQALFRLYIHILDEYSDVKDQFILACWDNELDRWKYVMSLLDGQVTWIYRRADALRFDRAFRKRIDDQIYSQINDQRLDPALGPVNWFRVDCDCHYCRMSKSKEKE